MVDMTNPVAVLSNGLSKRSGGLPEVTPVSTPKVETVPVTTEPAPRPVVEAAPQRILDDTIESRKRLKRVNPSSRIEDAFQDGPQHEGGFWSGVGTAWNDGLTANAYRAALDISEREESPADTAAKNKQRATLLDNVPEQYHEDIMEMPTAESAMRKSTEVRDRLRNTAILENTDGLSYLGSHITGFILDPSNLFAAAKVVQGVGALSKLTMGVHAANSLGGKVATLATAGGVEELVRNVPRLYSDPTYDIERYTTDAAIGVAFGAGLPITGRALRPAIDVFGSKSKSVAKTINDGIGDAANKYHVDVAAKHVMYTVDEVVTQASKTKAPLAAKTVAERIRKVDVTDAIHKGKVRAQESVDHSLRKYNSTDLDAAIREGLEGDENALLKALNGSADGVMSQFKRAAPNKEAVAEVADILQRKTSIFTPPKDAGSAARKTTVSDRVGDVKHDLEQSTKQMFKEAETAYKATYEALSDSSLAKMYNGTVPAAAKEMAERLKAAADVTHTAARNQLDGALAKIGKPRKAPGLSDSNMGKSLRSDAKVARETMNLTNAKLVGARTLHKLTPRMRNSLTGDRILRDALTAMGVKASGSVEATLTKHLSGLSSVERSFQIGRLQDGVDRAVQRLTRDANDHPTILALSPAKQAVIKKAIVNAETITSEALTRLNKSTDVRMDEAAHVKANIFNEVATVYAKQYDPKVLKEQFNDSLVQRGIKSQFGPLTESLSSRLIRSENKIAQWFTLNVLETPSGFGGARDRGNTAAVTAQIWDLQANQKVLKAYDTLLDSVADTQNLGMIKRRILKTGNAATHKEVEAVGRDVNLELNARNLGKTSEASPEVKKFVDELTNASSKLHELQVKHKVEGITNKNKIENYARQQWRDDKFGELFLDPNVGATGLRSLFEQGYLGAGMNPQHAKAMANAMVDLKKMDMNSARGRVYSLGKEIDHGGMPTMERLAARLRTQKTADVDILLDGLAGLKGQPPSYTQHRMKIDYSANVEINGKKVSILDLLDQDVPGNFARYSKEATARSAISQSTGGVLNSTTRMNEMIQAMSDEAVQNGKPINTIHVQDVLGQMMGTTYSGQLPINARRARDAVALAGMGGLGESQLAELGLAINRGSAGIVGLMQTAAHRGQRRKTARYTGMEFTPEQQNSKAYMEELQELTGLYEDMYLLQRYNIHFDQQGAAMNGTTGILDKVVNTATGGKHQPLLKYLQTRYTGYGVIRTWEDQTAMASLMHDVSKHFRGQKAFTSEARLKDIGILDQSGKADWLSKKFEDGTISIDQAGKIESLNIHNWSDMDKQKLGVALQRHTSQQVQKGFAGELSPEMANPWVAFMMQFRSYPMMAAEKQQARNAKFMDKEAAVGIGLNTISSAGARIVRAYSLALGLSETQDREAYLNKRFDSLGSDTFDYMGIAGMGPQIMDIFSSLGNGRDLSDQIPVINYIGQYQDALRASGKLLPGQDMATKDVKNIQTAMPLGTISFMNALMGQLKDATE